MAPEGRHPARALLRLLGAAWALAAAGCTTYDTALEEFDSVTQLEGAAQEPEQLVYQDAPERYPWLVRLFDGLVVGQLMESLSSRRPIEVEDPVAFARDRIAVLHEGAGNDLHRIAESAVRLLWVAELGGFQPANQSLALEGIADFLARLDVDPVQMAVPDPAVTTEVRVEAWLKTLTAGWPDRRDTASWSAEQRQSYLDAMAHLTELPLPDRGEQRALIRALDASSRAEPDRELRAATVAALRRALGHGLSLGLRNGLFAPDALVRDVAMRAIRRLGGPRAVPWILARVAKPPSKTQSLDNRFDGDPRVRLTLVRMCGQLPAAAAAVSVDGGPTALEYLYETFSLDRDQGLRRVALEALAQSLGRPVSFDPAWAEAWWSDDYVPNRGTGS